MRVLARSSAVRALLKGHAKPLTDLQVRLRQGFGRCAPQVGHIILAMPGLRLSRCQALLSSRCQALLRALPLRQPTILHVLQFAGGSGAGQAGWEGGALLASGGQDGQLYVWHLQLDEDGEAIHESQKLHASFVKEGGGECHSKCCNRAGSWPATAVGRPGHARCR